jgi:hypothetical protein
MAPTFHMIDGAPDPVAPFSHAEAYIDQLCFGRSCVVCGAANLSRIFRFLRQVVLIGGRSKAGGSTRLVVVVDIGLAVTDTCVASPQAGQ